MADNNKKVRIEKDTMGEMQVPADAYYGAQTQRAVENFPISGIRFPRAFIQAMGIIKKTAAQVNADLGLLDKGLSDAVQKAAQEVIDGRWDDQFVVDIFQTGSGTSTNMNTNEVIATRSNEILTGKKATKEPVHPNDHVNMGQSSNDVIPTAIHVAAVTSIQAELIPALSRLQQALKDKARDFDQVMKIGRTHLQDAVPMRLGQEFGGYARQVELAAADATQAQEYLAELALGGTAVGTGLNTTPEFSAGVIALVARETGVAFKEAENHFEAQAARDGAARASGAMKAIAVSLMKIANDIRWLASGPRTGFGEIVIPAVQPGSSIMPGKVNPVIPEAVTQVAAQVMGNDTTITVGCQAGNFELNVMMPVIAHNLLQSVTLLSSAADILAKKCVQGMTANEERCGGFVEQSLAMCTSLAPVIGYENAAAIAKEAYQTGETVRSVAKRKQVLSDEELEDLLNPEKMT